MENKWISVKDRMPEIDQVVVIRYGSDSNPCHAFGGRGWVSSDEWLWGKVDLGEVYLDGDDEIVADDDYQATHWMPLPDPPEQD